MREIKFRAWWKKHGVMVTSDLFEKLLNKDRQPVAYAPYRDVAKVDYLTGNPFSNPDLIIEQFTGLKDKNGREIYEGDIVAYRSETDPKSNPEVVEWDNGWRPFAWADGWEWDEEQSEVIGNIHESPQLLKK